MWRARLARVLWARCGQQQSKFECEKQDAPRARERDEGEEDLRKRLARLRRAVGCLQRVAMHREEKGKRRLREG